MPLEKTRRVSRSSPCPICRRPTWCLVAKDGRYAVCMRKESARPAHGGGWVHWLRDASPSSFSSPAWTPASSSQTTLLAPLARRHQVYAYLQTATVLSVGHRNALLARGYLEEEIVARRYRTLPLEDRWQLARHCHNGQPESLVGVPGFFQATSNKGFPYWSLAGCPGLLIPCCSPSGKIRAYRIRPDRVESDEGKYRWLSSGHKPGGVSSGVHAHVARPLGDTILDKAAWITEGEVKSDLAAHRLSAVVLSMPGVSSWTAVLPDLVEVLPAGGRVVVALDADWRENKAVHAAVWNTCLACQALGYEVRVAQWNPTHKGLDDLLTAGLRPTLTAMLDVPPTTWPLKVSARRLGIRPQMRQGQTLTIEAMRQRIRETIAAAFSAEPPSV